MTRESGNGRNRGGFAGLIAWILGGTALGLIEMSVAAGGPGIDFSGYSLAGFMAYYWVPALLGGILVWAGVSVAAHLAGRYLDGFAWGCGLFSAAAVLVYAGIWVNGILDGPPLAWPALAANVLVAVVAVLAGVLFGKAARLAGRRCAGRGAVKLAFVVVVLLPLVYLAWSWGNIEGGPRAGGSHNEGAGQASGELREGAKDSRPPNVILITVDALRADHLSLNGYERKTSPYLDRLAYEGANFSRAFSQATITVRSMASLFSSLYPQMHGLMKSGLRLPDSVLTLPEVLSMRGYSTAGFGAGNPSLYHTAGIVRGFDHYDDCRMIQSLVPMKVLSRVGLLTRISSEWEATCPPAEIVLEKARSWLKVNSSEPFFLFVHLMDVHSPYLPPGPFASQFGQRAEGAPTDAKLNARLNAIARRESALFFELVEGGEFSRMDELDLAPEDIGEGNLKRLIDLYDGEIAYSDSQLEAFIEELSAAGTLERTLLVITADHGEGFLDHGRLFHSGDLVYDELMRVPLIMRYPEMIPAGTCIDVPVRLIDIMPTILDAVDVESGGVPQRAPHLELEGRSLVGLFLGDEGESRLRGQSEVYCEGALVSCVRTSRWKYIDSKGHNSLELYDLVADPAERFNLFARADEQARVLAAVLEGYANRVRQYQQDHPGPVPVAVDKETRERLRSLGYVE